MSEQEFALEEGQGPLVNYRVLDLGVLFAGPMIGCFLAEFGADVVKVEDPHGGDSLRHLGWDVGGTSVFWKWGGRSKRTIAIDLRTEEGQELIRQLVVEADVLIENFRPGVMESWGLSWEVLHAINPKLVMVRVSGFGQDGPYRDRSGFGTLVEAMTGYASVNGWPDGPPTLPPYGLADCTAALAGSFATTSALLWRDAAGGEGQMIDLALTDPIFSIIGSQTALYSTLGKVPERMGNRLPFQAPRGAYQCRDGSWVTLSGASGQSAKRILTAVGGEELAQDERFETNHHRLENADALDEILQDWIGRHDRDEVLKVFVEAGAPIGPVYTVADIFDDPHFQHRLLVTVPDVDAGEVVLPNVLAKFSETPGRVRGAGRGLDQDRDEVLQDWLGRSPKTD
jgi:crotonobetainyl-CoA:carnitine CoA-transferase CaiB-like acyl-CoA transferase